MSELTSIKVDPRIENLTDKCLYHCGVLSPQMVQSVTVNMFRLAKSACIYCKMYKESFYSKNNLFLSF